MERTARLVRHQHCGAQVRGYVGQVQEEADDVVAGWHDEAVIRVLEVQYLGVVDGAPVFGLIARAEQAELLRLLAVLLRHLAQT